MTDKALRDCAGTLGPASARMLARSRTIARTALFEISYRYRPGANAPLDAGCYGPLSDRGQFLIGDGKNPPAVCVDATRIRAGAVFPAKRLRVLYGTCTPLLFDIEWEGALDRKLCSTKCSAP